jgi:hypothetical protein
MQLGGHADFYVLFFLESCIWSDARRQGWQVCIKCCANLGKSAKETLAMIRQVLMEESMSHEWRVQTHRAQEKARQVNSKVKSMLIIFFHIKGILHK